MKTIRCINPKNYRLTLNAEYQTLNETDNLDTYTIINDGGLRRNYRATLFEDVVTELTDAQIFASISLLEDNTITVSNRTEGTVNINPGEITLTRTPISCGIYQISNLNTIIGRIKEAIFTGFDQETVAFQDELIERIFKKYLVLFTMESNFLSLVLSTNNNSDDFVRIEELLSDMALFTHEGVNPNSNNTITFWYITKEELTRNYNEHYDNN